MKIFIYPDLRQIQAVLGQNPLKTTEIYIHITDANRFRMHGIIEKRTNTNETLHKCMDEKKREVAVGSSTREFYLP